MKRSGWLATLQRKPVEESTRLALVRRIWEEFEFGGRAASVPVFLENSWDDVEVSMEIGDVSARARGHAEMRASLPESPMGILGAKAYRFEESGDDVLVSAWVRVREHGGYMDAQVRWRYRFRGDKIAAVTSLPFS